MHDCIKWSVSAVCGALAAFFGQYGLFLSIVAVAIVLDVVTGLIKAKSTGEGLSSDKARKGFWRKITLFVGLLFGIFLDYATALVLVHTGLNLGVDMPFALIVCSYIIINESISIAENIYLSNPDSFPPQIGKYLKVARKELTREEEEKQENNR